MAQSRAPLIVAIVLLLVPVIYVGSYLTLVVPLPSPEDPFAIPYRVQNHWLALFYSPLEHVDRKVRPKAWRIISGDDEPLGIDFE